MLIIILLGIFLLPLVAQAHTITWDREADVQNVKEYRIYRCLNVGCVVQAVPPMLIGTVPQPAIGVLRPSLTYNLTDQEGMIGATAVDAVGNESALSVVPFDFKAPATVTGLGVAK